VKPRSLLLSEPSSCKTSLNLLAICRSYPTLLFDFRLMSCPNEPRLDWNCWKTTVCVSTSQICSVMILEKSKWSELHHETNREGEPLSHLLNDEETLLDDNNGLCAADHLLLLLNDEDVLALEFPSEIVPAIEVVESIQ